MGPGNEASTIVGLEASTTVGLDRTVGQAWSVRVGCPTDVPWMSHGHPLDSWTGQDSRTSLVSEGGMSNERPMDVQWTGRTILSGQRILMANLDMSVDHVIMICGDPPHFNSLHVISSTMSDL